LSLKTGVLSASPAFLVTQLCMQTLIVWQPLPKTIGQMASRMSVVVVTDDSNQDFLVFTQSGPYSEVQEIYHRDFSRISCFDPVASRDLGIAGTMKSAISWEMPYSNVQPCNI